MQKKENQGEITLYGTEARMALARGAAKIAKVASVTYGPCGRNVVLNRHFGTPVVTNDGVTIASEIFIPDEFENMGAMLVRSVSQKTNDTVGDGTTTAIVLMHSMMQEGVRFVEAGCNPVLLRNGMQKAQMVASKSIRSEARPVSGRDEIKRVATVSSGFEEIGELIADAMEKLPKDSIITIEESHGVETTCDIVNGMQFDRGYLTSHMITDQKRMEAVLEKPYILFTDQKITNIQELLPIMGEVAKRGRSLLLISDKIENEPLAAIIVNRMKGRLNCVCVKAPSFGDRRRDILEDMAIATGGTVVAEQLGMLLSETTVEQLGRCDKVVCDKDNTLIIGGKGDPQKVEQRIHAAKDELALAEFDFDQLKINERISRLAGGIGIIKVGAPTEVEQQEKKMRIEDAVQATRAAVQDGIIAGGGLPYVHAAAKVREYAKTLSLEEERFGAEIVARALEAPVRQIAKNAGVEGSVVLSRIQAEKDPAVGYDAKNAVYTDLVAAGVIDPVRVVIRAFENAVSAASTVIMTESLVTRVPNGVKDLDGKKPAAPAVPPVKPGPKGTK